MNVFVKEHFEIFQATQKLREQLMDILTDEDLKYSPGGEAMTLGALCKEMGEVEYSYLQSFKTFRQDFAYRNEDTGLADSVEKLKAWFKKLDADLITTLEGFSDEDLQKLIDRGTFQIPAGIQPHVYKEALFIFYGKASVYLRAMGKTLPEQWQTWIG